MKEDSPLSRGSAKFQTAATDGYCNVAGARWSPKSTKAWSRSPADCVPTSQWSMKFMAQALPQSIGQHSDYCEANYFNFIHGMRLSCREHQWV